MNNTITTNYDKQLSNKNEYNSSKNDEPFIDSYHSAILKNHTNDTIYNYEDIKKMSKDDIISTFGDTQGQREARNLFIATQFSTDPNMSKAMFEYTKTLPFEKSTNFLLDMFTQRNIYNNTLNDPSLRNMSLRKNIIDQIKDPDLKEQQLKLEKEFNETMLKVDMMQFFNDMLGFGKSEKEKNKNGRYGLLFNNFYNRYAMMQQLYGDTKSSNVALLNQYLGKNPII